MSLRSETPGVSSRGAAARNATRIFPFGGPFLALLALAGCGNSERDAAIANGARKLTKADARQALADRTLIGGIPHLNINFTLYYAADGRLVGAVTGAVKGRDRGAWRVAEDGKVCLRWSEWEDGDEKCRELWSEGDQLKIFDDKSGRAVSVARVQAGNTAKLEVKSDLELVQAKEPLSAPTAAELRATLAGNTITGRAAKGTEQHVYFASDNRTWISVPDDVIKDHGTYRIADDGKLCTTWSYLHGAHERCDSWFKTDKGFSVFDPFGKLALIGEVQPGNPHKLGQ